jgi:hypothetical protein
MAASTRVDLLAEVLLERCVKNMVEPRCNNLPLWDGGLGDVARAAIAESPLAGLSLGPVDIAREIGILKPSGVRKAKVSNAGA